MSTEICFTVRYSETTQTGIVHYSNYPVWFEIGRNDYLKKIGIPYSGIEAQGLFLPLSEMKCEFISPARFDDNISVITDMIYISCVKIKFRYKVLNKGSDKLLATGITVHAWTNRNLEPLNIEKAAPDIYKLVKQCVCT